MKKIATSFLLSTLIIFSTILTSTRPALGDSLIQQDNSDLLTESTWVVSIQKLDCSGSFDYFLYYPYSSKVISKVSLPQNQEITILNLRYTLPNNKGFLKLQYGKTGAEIKGRGSDTDWTDKSSPFMTYYGELDPYGDQWQLSLDYGRTLYKNNIHTFNLFWGWGKLETTNELKNIVYYLVKGISYTGIAQEDNGSSLDGKFSGFHLGFNDNMLINPKLALNTELTLAYLKTKACGYWANNAWNWEASGDTIGYKAVIGLTYAFTPHIGCEFGYCYDYSKSTGCEEVINGVSISQLADIEHEQKGFLLGLSVLF